MADRAEAIGVLADFREELYRCVTRRADALFELTDALLCTDGPVKTLVGLFLAPEHRRGHGALYEALNHGRIDVERRAGSWPACRSEDGGRPPGTRSPRPECGGGFGTCARPASRQRVHLNRANPVPGRPALAIGTPQPAMT
ncbi:transposase [Nucisporomicrobium flavum]|uniref:transposase n=1 Tax=Nucisporomicrobium flavum TaxID=2785915 RepID=UPI001F325366